MSFKDSSIRLRCREAHRAVAVAVVDADANMCALLCKRNASHSKRRMKSAQAESKLRAKGKSRRNYWNFASQTCSVRFSVDSANSTNIALSRLPFKIVSVTFTFTPSPSGFFALLLRLLLLFQLATHGETHEVKIDGTQTNKQTNADFVLVAICLT